MFVIRERLYAHPVQFVDTIRIIIKYLKFFQHISDHKESIITELYIVFG